MEQLTLKNFSVEWHSVCMDVLRINADCFSRSLKNLDDDEGITREELASK